MNLIFLIDSLPSKKSFYIIGNQLLRSGTSIGANLIEARASSSRLEFKKFYEIALKSANETKYWLSLLKDTGSVNLLTIDKLLQETTEIANMLAVGVMRLKNKYF